MTNFRVIGKGYKDTGEVPKDRDLYYRCTDCGDTIPSVPKDSIGCKCGNVFIDKDYWRLVVVDFGKFEILRKSN
jgi:hypothetical protein